jgi:hypothetical protein
MMDEKRIAELRAYRGSGMISAVGEYTPDELWEALDAVEKLRGALRMVGMLRQLGGMLPGSREVVQAVLDAADEALRA